jgi:hypothetical protein
MFARHRRSSAVTLTVLVLVAACGGGAASTAPASAEPSLTGTFTATAAPSTAVIATTAPTAAAATPAATSLASATPASATPAASGSATLMAPDTIGAGAKFEVAWTGPNNAQDYVTIVSVGTTKWTNEMYFDTAAGSTGTLVAPTTAGAYEVWYANGADDAVMARHPITVTPFAGTLDAPAQVAAGSPFQTAWTGPDGPSDYVTIVAAGATKWTTEPYFYTASGSPGTLVAPIAPGAYEVWYVTGEDRTPQARQPITVTPFDITLKAPAKVKKGADFKVTWTGPNGPTDYVTIVPKGSTDGTYLSYAYTAKGSPAILKAPTKAGNYEIWYASDRVDGTFARRSIVVK